MRVLEAIQRAMRGEKLDGFRMAFPPPVADLIGFRPVAVEEGAATFALTVRRDRHANPMGTLHGGILCDLADAAMGIACASLLDEGETFTTLELHINFLRPVMEGLLEARARVVHRGQSMLYAECEIVAPPEARPVARSSSTCLVLRGDHAKGR